MSLFPLVPDDLIERRNQILLRIHRFVEVRDLGFVLDDKPSPCHIWTGGDSGNGRGGGYGRVSINGETAAVHRVVYTHFYGYVPTKKQIDHKCNNRLCCNPAHLEMVSHLKNQRLRAKRARETRA